MPFHEPFNSYYEQIIVPAARESGLDALRSDEIYGAKPIIQDIWNHIWKARIVVADVTDRNPNVNYELGITHTLGVPTIIISKRADDVPFDYRHIRCVIYETEKPGWDDRLKNSLKRTIRALLDDPLHAVLEWPYDTEQLKEYSASPALISVEDPQKFVIRGAKLTADAVAGAYGPHGRFLSTPSQFGPSRLLYRGSKIAGTIQSSNVLEDRGIEQMRLAGAAVLDAKGDGTKLTMLLTHGFLELGHKLLANGNLARDVTASMDRAVSKIIASVSSAAQPCTSEDHVHVASTAGLSDRKIGSLVTDAFRKAGKDGVVTVIETGSTTETTLEFQEGFHFDRGYLSEVFVTDSQKSECVLEDCYILLYEKKISSMKEVLPILENVAKAGSPLLLIAFDVEGEALATLTVNKAKGALSCAAVRAPGTGDRLRATLEDIAVVTGARVINDEIGVRLENVVLSDLGLAKKVIISSESTTILGGAGKKESISGRIHSIRTLIDSTTSTYDQEKLRERLATLAGSIVTIRVGGATELDASFEKYKVESAMFSLQSAIAEGWIYGGGLGLLRAAEELREWTVGTELDSLVRSEVCAVLARPTSQLIENAKRSPTQLLAEINNAGLKSTGFNCQTRSVEDLRAVGIFDSAAVVIRALQVAVSHAKAVIQTGIWDTTPPKTSDRASMRQGEVT